MGKRSRRRGQEAMPDAPETPYTSPAGDVLTLRGAMTIATRQEYAALGGTAAASGEDMWQRRVEFLFERLAVRWELAGRRAARSSRRSCSAATASRPRTSATGSATCCATHLAEWFPELDAP